MWGFVASQVLISPFLSGYCVNPSYHKRIVCQALNGRLKAFRKLNHVRVRGRFKVRIHVMLSVIVLQARALAFPMQMRECVRKVA